MEKTIINAKTNPFDLGIKEIIKYRDLFFTLTVRDFKVRYVQTYLCLTLSLIKPALTVLVFSLIFGAGLGLDTGKIPYPLFAVCGLAAWSYFFIVMSQTGSSIIDIIKNYTIRLPSKLISSFEKKPKDLPLTLSQISDSTYFEKTEKIDAPLNITRSQLRIINEIISRIDLTVDENNYIDIVCTMPDPVASAEFTQLVNFQLTNYIIKNKTRKDLINKNFVEGRTDEATERFYSFQQNLALFKDQNMNIQIADAKTEEQKLQAEYELAFALYRSLSQQLEDAKIKVKENTSVFKVFEPIQIPLERSEPQRMKLIFISTFIGVFIGLLFMGLLFLKNNYQYIINRN